MSDSNKPLDPEDQKRLDTRGKGTGRDYQPFIFIQELSSTGESVRIRSSTVGRAHHLLSKIELAAFVIFDWCKYTIDLREQYPLPLEDTLTICSQFGIKHPQLQGKLKVVTTDLLVDFQSRKPLALSVKPSEALQDKRTLEKLSIEKAYWDHKGVEWCVFTEREVLPAFRENLDWLRPMLDESQAAAFHITESDVDDLFFRLKAYPAMSVTKACGKLDDEYHLPPGSHQSLLRCAVARRLLAGPMQESFHSWVSGDLQDLRPTLYEKGEQSAS